MEHSSYSLFEWYWNCNNLHFAIEMKICKQIRFELISPGAGQLFALSYCLHHSVQLSTLRSQHLHAAKIEYLQVFKLSSGDLNGSS
jgi:hypothetical protein